MKRKEKKKNKIFTYLNLVLVDLNNMLNVIA